MSLELITDKPFESGYDEVIAKEIAETLHKHYKGFMWIVSMQDHNPIIRLGEALQDGWCYLINRNDIPVGSPEKMRKIIITAGGEILERLKIQRKAKEDGLVINTLFEGTEHKSMKTAHGLSVLRKQKQLDEAPKLVFSDTPYRTRKV